MNYLVFWKLKGHITMSAGRGGNDTIDASIILVPVSKTSDRAPDYRILTNCVEAGAS